MMTCYFFGMVIAESEVASERGRKQAKADFAMNMRRNGIL
jgi:hypothetical protein